MRYSKDRKQQTRRNIVRSASKLFAAHGFKATSIEAIMRDCRLTRGGFYAHFQSKADLYRQAMTLATQSVVRHRVRSNGDWVDALVDEYLSMDSRVFFAADVASREPGVRSAYALACEALIERIAEQGVERNSATSLGAMLIGAVAMASTIDDFLFKGELVKSCKQSARALVQCESPQSFFWECMAGSHPVQVSSTLAG